MSLNESSGRIKRGIPDFVAILVMICLGRSQLAFTGFRRENNGTGPTAAVGMGRIYSFQNIEISGTPSPAIAGTGSEWDALACPLWDKSDSTQIAVWFACVARWLDDC